MTTRRKAPALAAPTTIEEAAGLIADYITADTELSSLGEAAAKSIATIQAAHDTAAEPLRERLRATLGQLRTWWTVARPALTDGKRKSIELGGAIIGDRTTPPSLRLPTGLDADAVIAELRRRGLDYTADVIRTKATLDRPALIKLLQADPQSEPARELAAIGLSVTRREEFFIDRAATAEPADEAVTDPALEAGAAARAERAA